MTRMDEVFGTLGATRSPGTSGRIPVGASAQVAASQAITAAVQSAFAPWPSIVIDGREGRVQQAWQDTAESVLANCVTWPTRTIDSPLRLWLPTVWQVMEFAGTVPLLPLVEAGLAFADIAAYGRVARPVGWSGAASPWDVQMPLLNDLTDLDVGMDVRLSARDAIGWLLVTAGEGERVAATVERVNEWDWVGLGRVGWLYMAAGLEPAEAAAQIRVRALDEERALVMAALRGGPLPAG